MTTILHIEDAAATERLARAIAPHLRAGDVLGLAGPLGVGKTAFARALILSRLTAIGRAEEVPSPSYTLVQTYDLGTATLWHADLYRLSSADELAELGLDEAFATAVCLVEWPERLGAMLPDRRLVLSLEFVDGDDDTARRARVGAAGGGWDWLAGALAAEAA